MKLLPILTALAWAALPAVAADAKKSDPKKPAPANKMEPAKKPAPAPPKKKTDMIEEDTVALLQPFDTNKDFEIDVEEFKAVEAEFKKNPKGPLKVFDKGHDGAVDAMIDRTGMNVKLGAAAPNKGAAKKPAPALVKNPAPPKPAEKKPETKPAGS